MGSTGSVLMCGTMEVGVSTDGAGATSEVTMSIGDCSLPSVHIGNSDHVSSWSCAFAAPPEVRVYTQ